MKTILNKEKARELSDKYKKLVDYSLEQCLIEMAEWKDEQFQKVLDYAENCYGVFSFEQREKFIDTIKKIYEGE